MTASYIRKLVLAYPVYPFSFKRYLFQPGLSGSLEILYHKFLHLESALVFLNLIDMNLYSLPALKPYNFFRLISLQSLIIIESE